MQSKELQSKITQIVEQTRSSAGPNIDSSTYDSRSFVVSNIASSAYDNRSFVIPNIVTFVTSILKLIKLVISLFELSIKSPEKVIVTLILFIIILLFLFSSKIAFILVNSIETSFVDKEIINLIINITNNVDLDANYNFNAIY